MLAWNFVLIATLCGGGGHLKLYDLVIPVGSQAFGTYVLNYLPLIIIKSSARIYYIVNGRWILTNVPTACASVDICGFIFPIISK